MNPLCERCEENGIIRPMDEVHHILPADERPDLFYSLDNLMSLCFLCHKQVTNEYHKQRRWHRQHPQKKYGNDLQQSLTDFDLPLS